MTRLRRPWRPTARWAGAAASAGAGLMVVALVLARPPSAWLAEQAVLVAPFVVITAAIGWWAANLASSGGWLAAIGAGIAAGTIWWPVAVLVSSAAIVVDGLSRGTLSPPEAIGAWLGLTLWPLLVAPRVLVVTVAVGVAWGLVTRALVRGLALPVEPANQVGARVALCLFIVVVVAGSSLAVRAAPPSVAGCLGLPAGYATDAAFSPRGDMLAIATQVDPNSPGEILLLRWPSSEEIGRWQGWVAGDLAVAPGGELFWSAWLLGLGVADATTVTEGVYVARSGVAPDWFATGYETTLRDLVWTERGLRGVTPSSHHVASLLAGDTAPRIDPQQIADEVGAFWSSSDGLWTAISSPGSRTVRVDGPSGGASVSAQSEPRSLALTAGHRRLVAAGWFDGGQIEGAGTDLIDVATGQSRRVLSRSQRFVSVSAAGDLAWVDDELVGHGRLCVAPLALL